jgi:hypothetical protein
VLNGVGELGSRGKEKMGSFSLICLLPSPKQSFTLVRKAHFSWYDWEMDPEKVTQPDLFVLPPMQGHMHFNLPLPPTPGDPLRVWGLL